MEHTYSFHLKPDTTFDERIQTQVKQILNMTHNRHKEIPSGTYANRNNF